MKFQKLLIINISDSALDSTYWQQLNALAETIVKVPKDDPSIMSELVDTDGLLVNFGIDVTKAMVDTALNLKYIGVLATAFGKIDIEYAASKNIPVCNLAGYSTESVAEFTIATILENIRDLEEGKQRGRSENYDESGIFAREIKGSNFVVLGLGDIGSRVAELAKGFGANISYWSRKSRNEIYNYGEIDEVIAKADFLSINLAQAPETEQILSAERINTLKPGAVVVNTAPMELVDINGLATRLAKGDMTFILDHSDEMTKEELAKLQPYTNCIIYPPIAYITEEARQAKQNMFIGNAKSFLEGKIVNRVN